MSVAWKPVLSAFQPVAPLHLSRQSDSLDWLAEAHARSADFPGDRARFRRLLARFAAREPKLCFRGHELSDFLHRDWDRMEIFSSAEGPRGAKADRRLSAFARFADRAFSEIYNPSLGQNGPDALIHVTCTGYESPSAAQRNVLRKGWSTRTSVLHAYHMGCYAAFPALGWAQALVCASANPAFRADVVHSEFCTLHLDPSLHEPEQLVVQSLFADGAIGYSVSREFERSGLALWAIHDELVLNTSEAMTWKPSAWGMRMTLSRDVPREIGAALPGFVERLLQKAGLTRQDLGKATVWAIHPGGPRILDQAQEILRLEDRSMKWSREVFQNRGNMSSATVPHIWERALNDPEVEGNTPVVSLAFGPGLSICGSVMVKR